MAILFVSAGNNGQQFNNAAGTFSISGYSVTGGNALVVGCAAGNNSTQLSATLTDSVSNSFSQISGASAFNSGFGLTVAVFVALNCTASASDTLTWNTSCTGFGSMVVAQFSGVKTSAAVDQSAKGDSAGSATSVTSGSFTPGSSGEVSVAYLGSKNQSQAGTFTAGGSYTIPANGHDGYSIGAIEYLINPATSSQTASMTTSFSVELMIGVVTLLAAAGASFQPDEDFSGPMIDWPDDPIIQVWG